MEFPIIFNANLRLISAKRYLRSRWSHSIQTWYETIFHNTKIIFCNNNFSWPEFFNQKLDTQYLPVSGDCRKMAGAFCITHPLDIFSLNFFNYNIIIILPNPHYLHPLFDSHSIYITTIKYHYKFNL